MKRIAFACEDNRGLQAEMSMHFGRCPYFTLVDIAEGAEPVVTVVDNPYYNNHVPGAVPQFMHTQNTNVMIAGGMGPKAIGMFEDLGIHVVTGVGGAVGNVLQAYLDGKISGTAPCAHDHAH